MNPAPLKVLDEGVFKKILSTGSNTPLKCAGFIEKIK